MKINIILIVDDAFVKKGIKALIAEQNDMIIAEEANSLGEAIEILKGSHDQFNMIIKDIRIPITDGIACTRQLKKQFPHLPIIVLSRPDGKQHIRNVLQAGASAYVSKHSSPEDLINAIRSALMGKTYFSPELVQMIIEEMAGNVTQQAKPPLFNVYLTQRETEILDLIVDEHTNLEIAEKLFISARTVDTHRRNLLQKTGSRNTAGLVKYALQKRFNMSA